MKRMLCLWLPNWPIQRIVAARPELKGRALILYTRKGSRGQRVVACSAEASAAGVSPDMPVSEATSLMRKSRRGTVVGRNKRSAVPADIDDAGTALRLFRPTNSQESIVFQNELYDPAADRQKLEQFAEWCEKFSPIVGLEPSDKPADGEPAEPESLLLDVTGLAPLFGGEEALLRKIVTELAQQGYQARAAVADSIGAAWGVVRFAHACGSGIDLEQEGTSQHSKSCCVNEAEPRTSAFQGGTLERAVGSSPLFWAEAAKTFVVPAGQNATALAPLPLAALRLPAATISILQQLGLQQVGELLRLPRASLTSRFGDGLIVRIDQALGRVRELVVAHRPQPTFQAEWLLEYPTVQRQLVELITRQLIERVSHLLMEQNRGAIRLEICLRCVADEELVDSPLGQPVLPKKGDCPPTNSDSSIPHPRDEGARDEGDRPLFCANPAANPLILPTRRYPPLLFRVGLFRPTAVPRHLWDLAQLQFEQTQWPGPVERITVQANLTAPLKIRQGQLFEDGVRDGQQQLTHLIERLSNRLGMECVLQPRVVADAQPDRACRYIPLTGRLHVRPGKGNGEEKRQLRFRALDRPLFLQQPPLPLQVLTAVNQKPPARFRDEQHWHAVIHYWGPERIETGWWRGNSVRRDYYRVETETGQWFWIYRQLDNGHWFLHGRYE
jgi:protein ImuB